MFWTKISWNKKKYLPQISAIFDAQFDPTIGIFSLCNTGFVQGMNSFIISWSSFKIDSSQKYRHQMWMFFFTFFKNGSSIFHLTSLLFKSCPIQMNVHFVGQMMGTSPIIDVSDFFFTFWPQFGLNSLKIGINWVKLCYYLDFTWNQCYCVHVKT